MPRIPRLLALSLLNVSFLALTACAGTGGEPTPEPGSESTTSTIDPTSGAVDITAVIEELAVALAREANALAVFSDDGQATAAHLEQVVRDYEATGPSNVSLPRPGEAATVGCATITYRAATDEVHWHVAILDGTAVVAAGTCMF